ncbi:MAG: AtzE family amidohydrolase [Pantoea sp. Brub]|nr:AtzE family amidohydrolase [Pantoea sp. Brub]
MKLYNMSILDLNKSIRNGNISATEIANETIKLIHNYNPLINAWTKITDKRMLKEASFIDKNKGIKLSLLAGIPYAVKNIFDVAGYTTIAGANMFSNRIPALKDAWVINKLCKSGSILSGMLNMDAYAYGFTTENSYYGTTRNPRNLQYIAGGSSGGSASAVASGLVHYSLGTDTNGSVRVPSSLCGIFSLKPTFGRISRNGVHTFVPSLDNIGFFSRRVDDLAIIYDYIQGKDNKDKFQVNCPIQNVFSKLHLGKNYLNCGILSGFFSTWCDNNAKIATNIVGKALQANDEIVIEETELARSAAYIITASESGNQYLPILRQTPEKFEINSKYRLIAGAMIPSAWYIQAQRFRRFFQKKVLSILKKIDILIAPATPCTAVQIGQQNIHINNQDLLVRSNMGMLTQPISFLGLPVCTVPVMTSNTLPIGIQLISAPFKEDILLYAAYILEQQGITATQINITDIKQ